MHRLVILASVIVLTTGGAGCGGGNPDSGSSSSVLAPTPVGDSSNSAVSGSGKGGGKPSGTSSSSLALVMVTDSNGNGQPNWGDQITFQVSTTATSEPHVDLTCTQNGVVVYGATTGFYSSYPWPWTQIMTLSSTAWQGGAANCTAKLYYFAGSKTPTLATLNFTALE